jgi:hypothetical protein
LASASLFAAFRYSEVQSTVNRPKYPGENQPWRARTSPSSWASAGPDADKAENS